jgi:hypothetical protein
LVLISAVRLADPADANVVQWRTGFDKQKPPPA